MGRLISAKSRQRRRRGGAVLELALTLSLLFSICFGAIEFGYYFFVKNMMTGGAREGCRTGVVAGSTNTTINTAILTQLQISHLVASNLTASSSMPSTIGSYSVSIYDNSTSTSVSDVTTVPVGDTLIVQITATWGTVGGPFRPLGLIGSTKTVLGACAMRKEG